MDGLQHAPATEWISIFAGWGVWLSLVSLTLLAGLGSRFFSSSTFSYA